MRRGRRPARGEGYNLVFLIFLIGLMSVMATAALPVLEKQIQRDKEAELIFRGLQYAEGIRVFQQRFGRYPTRLEELIELEPRSMRQLYDDPMVADGRWGVVLAATANRGGGSGGGTEETDPQGRDLARGTAPSSGFSLQTNAQTPTGPIIGVVSRKKGVGLRTFLGQERYEEWRFTPNILPRPQVIPGTAIVVRGSVENLGKPFPRGLEPVGFGTIGGDGSGTDLVGGEGPDDLFEEREEGGG